MTSRFVREIGRVEDSYGLPVIIGVDYDAVTIEHDPHVSGMRLSQDKAEEFARLFTAACWEAARCHQCDCPPEYQHPERNPQ